MGEKAFLSVKDKIIAPMFHIQLCIRNLVKSLELDIYWYFEAVQTICIQQGPWLKRLNLQNRLLWKFKMQSYCQFQPQQKFNYIFTEGRVSFNKKTIEYILPVGATQKSCVSPGQIIFVKTPTQPQLNST